MTTEQSKSKSSRIVKEHGNVPQMSNQKYERLNSRRKVEFQGNSFDQ